MAEFTVNAQRVDSYKNFKFRLKWDKRYIAGVSRVSALLRTTQVVAHRQGGDPSTSRKASGARPSMNRSPSSAASRTTWNSNAWRTRSRPLLAQTD
jgi:hypothetical protein